MAKVRQNIKYLDVAEKILTEIHRKGLIHGSSLLPAPKLAEKYQVSLKTVTSAMHHLTNLGAIYRKQGSGTFVNRIVLEKRQFLIGCSLRSLNFDNRKIDRIIASYSDAALEYFNAEGCRVRHIPIEAYNHPDEITAYFGGLDGLLISGAHLLESSCKIVESLNIPTVVFQTGIQWKLQVSQVISNHTPGIRDIFRKAQKRYAGLIVFYYWYPNIASRMAMFVREALRAGYRRDEIELVKLEFGANIYPYSKKWAGRCRNQLIFCCSDEVTWELIGALREEGCCCPRDYELVSYDNFESYGVSFWGEPTVTSINFPMREEAELAAKLLLEQLKNPDGILRIAQLPTSLVIRKTALNRASIG